ncbi:MAG: hypothetical protein PUI05_02605 [Peptoniphilaceae bacterium]|nr:hypothetical protein [Peptoniphilaceae bacterium]
MEKGASRRPPKHRPLLLWDFPLNFYKVQDNLHDKALIIDDDYLLTGGRNIGKKFFVEDDSVAYDLDLLIERKSEDSSIDDYKAYYESLINKSSVKKLEPKEKYKENLKPEDFNQATGEATFIKTMIIFAVSILVIPFISLI